MKCTKGIFSIPFILLMVLIILFHNELFALGLRIYVSFKPNAHAERLLGNYYETSSHQNKMLANQFYSKSLLELQEVVKTASEKQQAEIKYRLGSFYECGWGTPKDYNQAKKYYEEALLASAKEQPNVKLQENIKTAIDRANKLLQNQANPLCPYLSDLEFMRSIISDEQF